MAAEPIDLHEIVIELRLLRTEFQYIKDRLIEQSKAEVEIFDRLRGIENELAVVKAQRTPRVSGWTITAVVITGLLAFATMVEKLSL